MGIMVRSITGARLTAFVFSLLLVTPACAQVDDAPAYVASSRGTVYYWTGWHNIPEGNRRWFETSAEAEAAGYRRSDARGCAGPEATAGPSPIDTGICTVERVVDGDTLTCREAADRVRLLLIDAPELSVGEPAARASAFLASLLPRGTEARLELDIQERDRYGRILAYVFTADGRMINEVMARSGYAVTAVYPPNVRHVDRIRAAVAEARAARRGLWASPRDECTPDGFTVSACG